MKKRMYLLLVMMMCGLLFFGSFTSQAAGKTTKKKAVFTIKKYTASYKAPKVTAKYRYDLPILKGSSKAVKKINNSLKKKYKSRDKNTILDYAKATDSSRAYTEGWYDISKCKVSYNKNGYLSFRYFSDWYAGGVTNTWYYGMNYSLKTGKKLKISDVMSGSSYQIKRKIANAANAKGYTFMESGIMNMKISEFEFYLKDGKVVVCFGPYLPGAGNGHVNITVQGNY